MVSERLLKLYRALDNVPECLSISDPPDIIRGDFDNEELVLRATDYGSLTYTASVVEGDEHLEAVVTYLPCGRKGNLLEGIKRTLNSSIKF